MIIVGPAHRVTYMASSYPRDLAIRLLRHLHQVGRRPPPLLSLTRLFEVAYFASMRRDESRPCTCTLVFMDPKHPDPDPPLVRPQRGSLFPFENRVALTAASLAKLAQAAPRYSAALAVFADAAHRPFAWGMFDQELHFESNIHFEGEVSFGRPGVFQLQITGQGALTVYDEKYLIATLRQDSIAPGQIDVFSHGPVNRCFRPFVRHHMRSVRNILRREAVRPGPFDLKTAAETWTDGLRRLLLAIRRQGHGGALLLLPRLNWAGLRPKYVLQYRKLATVLALRSASRLIAYRTGQDIIEDYLDPGLDTVPADLYLKESIAKTDESDAISAEAGCATFVAGLSRIDGLVLATGNLAIQAFGVEITTREEPPRVHLATTATAQPASLRSFAIDSLGTRHRSMMRYCWAYPGSVGFVVSQDGDVRAVLRDGRRLLVWDNVRIQRLEPSPPSWKARRAMFASWRQKHHA